MNTNVSFQTAGISCPAYSMDRSNTSANVPASSYRLDQSMHTISFCRSFSTATYHQPIYPLQVNSSLCYTPIRQGVCPSVSQRLHSMEVRNIGELPETSDADDDVFAPSGPRNMPPHPGITVPLPPMIPCSPTTLQLMQSRKRAHSAGDMIGVYSPTVARLLYSNSHQVTMQPQTFNVQNNECAPSYVNNMPSGSTLPQKWIITDQSSSSKFDHIHKQQPRNFSNLSNSLIKNHPAKPAVPVPVVSCASNTHLITHAKHAVACQGIAISQNGKWTMD